MPFYKKEDDQLLSGNSVHGPGFTLLEQEHEVHTYPVDGWYWFANLDAAAQEFTKINVTLRQIQEGGRGKSQSSTS